MEFTHSSLELPHIEDNAVALSPSISPKDPASWEDPVFSEKLLRNLEDFSGAFRDSISEQSKLKSEIHYTGQQMSQVFGAMSQLLDVMYDRLLGPAANLNQHASNAAPQLATIDPECLNSLTQSLTRPLCDSLDQGFGEVNRRVHMSEERHLSALQASLQQLQLERELNTNSFHTQIETMRVHTRVEFNRLLQVLLLGTAVAAAGAAGAFILLRH